MAKRNWTYDEIEALYKQVFPNAIDGGGRVVLLADGEGSSRSASDAALSRCGFRVESVTDGLEALHSILYKTPDCCIFDVHLDHAGGVELLQVLKQDPLYRDIPVILTYGSRGDEEALIGGILGAAAVIDKPIQGEILVQKIADILSPRKDMISG